MTTVPYFGFVSGKTLKLVRNVEWERLGDYRSLVGSKMQYKSVSVKPVFPKKKKNPTNFKLWNRAEADLGCGNTHKKAY